MSKNYLPDILLSMRCTKAMRQMGKYLAQKLCCHLNLNLCKLIKMFSFIQRRLSFPPALSSYFIYITTNYHTSSSREALLSHIINEKKIKAKSYNSTTPSTTSEFSREKQRLKGRRQSFSLSFTTLLSISGISCISSMALIVLGQTGTSSTESSLLLSSLKMIVASDFCYLWLTSLSSADFSVLPPTMSKCPALNPLCLISELLLSSYMDPN